MKRIATWILAASLALAAFPSLHAADAPPSSDHSPVAEIAAAVTTVTGIAISPLLGTGAYGAYKYFTAETPEQKARLPWFANPAFFVTALALVGICAAKDAVGAALPPGFKKPLDVLETIENKISGLVAAGAVIPITMGTLSKVLAGSGQSSIQFLDTGNLAVLPLAAADFSWVLTVLTVPLAVFVFAFVWMAFHAINVLILLSPWGAVDAALKTARTSVLALLGITAWLDPETSAILSLIIIVISYFVAGWAFRLTVFGCLFCWDFLSLRHRRFSLNAGPNKVFSGTTLKKVPVRTYGKLALEPENGRMTFHYRPWLVLAPREASVELLEPRIGRGLFYSTLLDGPRTVMMLPPRYRGHEEAFARAYQIEGGVQDAGLLKAWGALRELFTGSATQVQVR